MFDFLGYETTIGSLLFTFVLMYLFGRGYRKLFKEDDDHVEARKRRIVKEEKLDQQKKEIKEIEQRKEKKKQAMNKKLSGESEDDRVD